MATIADLLKIDYNTADAATLRKAVQQLSDAANKRVRRGLESGITQAAIVKWQQQGKGMFSTRGKTSTAALKSEYKRVKQFLEAKTSTISGAKKVDRETRQRLERETGVRMDQQQGRVFSEAMNKIKERVALDDSKQSPRYAGAVKQYVAEMVEQGMSADQIAASAEEQMAESAFEDEFDMWGI